MSTGVRLPKMKDDRLMPAYRNGFWPFPLSSGYWPITRPKRRERKRSFFRCLAGAKLAARLFALYFMYYN